MVQVRQTAIAPSPKGARWGAEKVTTAEPLSPYLAFLPAEGYCLDSSPEQQQRACAEIQSQLFFALLGLQMDKLLLHVFKETATSRSKVHLEVCLRIIIVPTVTDREGSQPSLALRRKDLGSRAAAVIRDLGFPPHLCSRAKDSHRSSRPYLQTGGSLLTQVPNAVFPRNACQYLEDPWSPVLIDITHFLSL